MKFIDLTHTFQEVMPVYSGDPIPTLIQVAQIQKHGYNDSEIKTTMHVGTHIDAPLHMIENGKPISEYPADTFCGRGIILDARNKSEINSGLLQNISIQKDDIVLIFTDGSRKYGENNYFTTYPEIKKEFAEELVKKEVKMVGMDSPSPDKEPYEVHKIFLRNDILIIENLINLDQLVSAKSFEVIALPMKFHADAAPARVIAKIQ